MDSPSDHFENNV